MIALTGETMKAVFPLCHDPNYWASLLPKIASQFGINTVPRFGMWLAQCGYESNQFNAATGRENMSYSAAGLVKTFPHEFPTIEKAEPFARMPQQIACVVYANRLGNGNVASSDGWNYRGGGMIQLTGRANYASIGKALGIDLVGFPRQIEKQDVSAKVAAYFWQSHGCNELADAGEFERITETINGKAELGETQRLAFWQKLQGLLK